MIRRYPRRPVALAHEESLVVLDLQRPHGDEGFSFEPWVIFDPFDLVRRSTPTVRLQSPHEVDVASFLGVHTMCLKACVFVGSQPVRATKTSSEVICPFHAVSFVATPEYRLHASSHSVS